MIRFKDILHRATRPAARAGQPGEAFAPTPADESPADEPVATAAAAATAEQADVFDEAPDAPARQPLGDVFAVDDEVIEGVLDDIFPDGAEQRPDEIPGGEEARAWLAGDEAVGPAEKDALAGGGEALSDTVFDEHMLSVIDQAGGLDDAAVEATETAEGGDAQPQQAEAADDEVPSQEPTEGAEASGDQADEGSVGESMMDDVDRLLAELGQITLPEVEAKPEPPEAAEAPLQDAPVQEETPAEADGEAAGQRPGAGPEEDLAAALTEEERQALFADDSVEPEQADGADQLAASLSAEVDEAITDEALSAVETTGLKSQVELDFTPEAVGLSDGEESADKEDEAEDVDDLLAKLLEEVGGFGDAGAPAAGEEPEEDSSLSELLAGPMDEGAAESAGADGFREMNVEEDIWAEISAGQAEDGPGAASDQPDAGGADEGGPDALLSEEELLAQALEEAAAVNPAASKKAEEVKASPPPRAARADAPPPGGAKAKPKPDARRGAKDEPPDDRPPSPGGNAAAMDTDALLADLEASLGLADQAQAFEAAASEAEASPEPEPSPQAAKDAATDQKPGEDAPQEAPSEEDVIQQEVIRRSKEVEQRVLDELFGGDTEEFSRELRNELAQVDDQMERQQADEDSGPPGVAGAGGIWTAGEGAAASAASQRPQFASNAHMYLTWIAYQMNRPFLRWLTPARRKALAVLSVGLISLGCIWLATALTLLWRGQ